MRQLVETLFRAGTLRVVIATGVLLLFVNLRVGTLALGINMPCRTVIFAGDSVFVSRPDYISYSLAYGS